MVNEIERGIDNYWIGLYYDKPTQPEGTAGTTWLWEDKHSVAFTNWGKDEPKDTAGNYSYSKINIFAVIRNISNIK